MCAVRNLGGRLMWRLRVPERYNHGEVRQSLIEVETVGIGLLWRRANWVVKNHIQRSRDDRSGVDPRSLHEDDGENTDQTCESGVYGSCSEKLENRLIHLQTGKAEVALADELDGLRGAVFALQNSLPSLAEMTLLENSNPLHEKDVADVWQICCKCWGRHPLKPVSIKLQEFRCPSLIVQVPRDEKAKERNFMNCVRLLVEVCGDGKIVKASLYATRKSQGKEAQIITDIVTMLFDPSPDTKRGNQKFV
ncbi:hypothetical protein BSKO_05515 [Bryopsis sp. KO-2023]|nr:hypothetical protein BSKO_05507 [Bryopsis sp. KO-2023]GMH37642.1 hypothetical protein BSKO_05515 [Bryopsis sp. KO-2023]